MTGATLVVLAVGFLLAHANGANDVSKGVATLVGSGTTSYRTAIRWGALWTGVGALAGGSIALAMVATFGRGLLAPSVHPTWPAALATILGATAWVVLATRTGLPVSTTHAILGALAGVGALAYGAAGVAWWAVVDKIALPLLLSPLVSLAGGLALARLAAPAPAPGAADCVCVGVDPVVAPVSLGAAALVASALQPSVSVGTAAGCAAERPAALRLTLDHLHWFTAAAISFARGLNDGPKLAALVLAAGALLPGTPIGPRVAFALVALGMVAGSLAGGRRVTRVLAEDVTAMSHGGGFAANLVTAVLVGLGAVGGLPMSTTHVSTGAIVGMGVGQGGRRVEWRTVRSMLLAWVVTLPAAALLGIAFLVLLRLPV